MITPRLALNFTTGVLDPRITVTRTLNTATCVNSSGFIEIVNADLPRFNYDPVTLSPLGLLIEEQRANLMLYSEDFTAGVWAKTQSSITPSATTAPNGLVSGSKLIENTANAGHILDQSRAVTSGVTYVSSIFAKAGERTSFSFRANNDNSVVTFNLANGTAGAATNGTAFITPFGNGWYRCSLVWTATTTATVVVLRIRLINGSGASSYTGDGVSGLYVYGGQIESGAFVTSYIPTTTTALTRNTDVATITGTNFSNWWNLLEGSVVARYRPSTVSGTRPVIQFDDTTADEIICLRGNTTNPELYIKDSTDQATIDAGTIAANIDYRFAAGWKLNDCAASINSGTPVLDGAATLPTVTQTRLGCDGTNYLNGHLQTIEYYNRKLTNGTLQQLASSAGRFSVLSPILRQVVQS